MVVLSTALQAKKENTLARKVAYQQEHWNKETAKLATIDFASEADARREIEVLLG